MTNFTVPESSQVVSATNEGNEELLSESLHRVLNDLVALLTDEDAEYRPAPDAFMRAWRLVERVGEQMGKAFPFGYACVDGEGGVRFEWRHGHRQVSVQIPAQKDGQEYIYHQEGKNYSVEQPVTPGLVGTWLAWLADG